MSDDARRSPDGTLAEISEATIVVNTEVFRHIREKQGELQAYLIVLSGPEVGHMHKIEEPSLVLGRQAGVGMRINDAGVSRQHARLVRDSSGGIFIEDLGSVNGTFLNGDPLERPLQLRDGDKITLGSTTILKFTYHDRLDENFQKKMFDAAVRDSLTGAFNKRYFIDHLATEFAYAQRHHSQLALIMFDVDHFKRINDTYGHLAGDEVLVRLGAMALNSVRSEDLFARYGGEEFVILARGITMHQAAHLGERLRRFVERTEFEYGNSAMPVTISVGVAGIPALPLEAAQEIIEAADTALYAAKRNGRNRVMLATPK
ncbi:MAG: GGDEF domain-containing protein [Myxococcota bacterium]